jgi:hypothetical protein
MNSGIVRPGPCVLTYMTSLPACSSRNCACAFARSIRVAATVRKWVAISEFRQRSIDVRSCVLRRADSSDFRQSAVNQFTGESANHR